MKCPPSMREKERYIVFHVISENNRKFSYKEILNAIMHSIILTIGIINSAKAFLYLIEWNEEKNFGIFRTTNKFNSYVIFAISLISQINGIKVSFNTLKTCGTIKKAREFIRKNF
ncbi:MAG: Rpp14/Pop5 family protein [Candidatus Altarchaeaceae archaeon]